MAKIRDRDFEDTGVELEITLSPSEFYDKPAEWVSARLVFRFGENYPDISIKRDCQEIQDIEHLIDQIRRLTRDEISRVDFSPLEPDYHLVIKHCRRGKYEKEDNYSLYCLIDSAGSRGGAYHGVGPALEMFVCREDLNQFTDELENELKKIASPSP